ncbi:30S ribosomal protein S17 [Patescibacteria group bacterium]
MSKKRFTGKVVSTKMEKTAVIAVETPKRHPVYKKLIKNTKKFKARDEIGVKVGDVVTIEECVPFSKTVKWKVVENK